MGLRKFRQSGFTLVEMIVVIAIIAILAAVIIPTTAGFIDRARLSNDQQTAAQMNRALTALVIEDDQALEDVCAAYIRDTLDAFGDTPFDWTPKSRNRGYFYLEASEKIIVVSYNQAGEGIELFSQSTLNQVFNVHPVKANQGLGETPEELFGAGIYLLTMDGSIVAQTVYGLRMLPYAKDLKGTYDALVAEVSSLDGLFKDTTHKERLEVMLTSYDPKTTLFVTDITWRFQEQTSEHIGWSANRVLMAPGIANIPTYHGPRTTVLSTIVVPRTVRTIESGAFSAFRQHPSLKHEDSIGLPKTVPIQVQTGAFSSAQEDFLNTHRNVRVAWEVPPLAITLTVTTGVEAASYEFPGHLGAIVVYPNSVVSLDLTRLNRSVIKHINLEVRGGQYHVRIYTSQGLLGALCVPIDYLE